MGFTEIVSVYVVTLATDDMVIMEERLYRKVDIVEVFGIPLVTIKAETKAFEVDTGLEILARQQPDLFELQEGKQYKLLNGQYFEPSHNYYLEKVDIWDIHPTERNFLPFGDSGIGFNASGSIYSRALVFKREPSSFTEEDGYDNPEAQEEIYIPGWGWAFYSADVEEYEVYLYTSSHNIVTQTVTCTIPNDAIQFHEADLDEYDYYNTERIGHVGDWPEYRGGEVNEQFATKSQSYFVGDLVNNILRADVWRYKRTLKKGGDAPPPDGIKEPRGGLPPTLPPWLFVTQGQGALAMNINYWGIRILKR